MVYSTNKKKRLTRAYSYRLRIPTYLKTGVTLFDITGLVNPRKALLPNVHVSTPLLTIGRVEIRCAHILLRAADFYAAYHPIHDWDTLINGTVGVSCNL